MNGPNEQLGKLIDDDGKRDAIHIAIAPVIAHEKLYPGQNIGHLGENIASAKTDKIIGIVDPFLKGPVFRGQEFYMLLYPNTITDLKHVWEHWSFDNQKPKPKVKPKAPAKPKAKRKPTKAQSKKWLTEYANIGETTYERLMEETEGYVNGDYGIRYPSDLPSELFTKKEEFWEHIRNMGVFEIPEDAYLGVPFWCSC